LCLCSSKGQASLVLIETGEADEQVAGAEMTGAEMAEA